MSKRTNSDLQEEKRDLSLAAELDEVGALHGGLGKQDAVVADDADGHPVQPREASHLDKQF